MINVSQAFNELKTEDFIWIVYSFIILGALISNVIEREWISKHDMKSYRRFHSINATILFVSFLIYSYFVWLNYKRLKQMNPNTTIKNLFLNEANFVASCLFLLGGLIYLFTELASTSFQTEPQELI